MERISEEHFGRCGSGVALLATCEGFSWIAMRLRPKTLLFYNPTTKERIVRRLKNDIISICAFPSDANDSNEFQFLFHYGKQLSFLHAKRDSHSESRRVGKSEKDLFEDDAPLPKRKKKGMHEFPIHTCDALWSFEETIFDSIACDTSSKLFSCSMGVIVLSHDGLSLIDASKNCVRLQINDFHSITCLIELSDLQTKSMCVQTALSTVRSDLDINLIGCRLLIIGRSDGSVHVEPILRQGCPIALSSVEIAKLAEPIFSLHMLQSSIENHMLAVVGMFGTVIIAHPSEPGRWKTFRCEGLVNSSIHLKDTVCIATRQRLQCIHFGHQPTSSTAPGNENEHERERENVNEIQRMPEDNAIQLAVCKQANQIYSINASGTLTIWKKRSNRGSQAGKGSQACIRRHLNRLIQLSEAMKSIASKSEARNTCLHALSQLSKAHRKGKLQGSISVLNSCEIVGENKLIRTRIQNHSFVDMAPGWILTEIFRFSSDEVFVHTHVLDTLNKGDVIQTCFLLPSCLCGSAYEFVERTALLLFPKIGHVSGFFQDAEFKRKVLHKIPWYHISTESTFLGKLKLQTRDFIADLSHGLRRNAMLENSRIRLTQESVRLLSHTRSEPFDTTICLTPTVAKSILSRFGVWNAESESPNVIKITVSNNTSIRLGPAAGGRCKLQLKTSSIISYLQFHGYLLRQLQDVAILSYQSDQVEQVRTTDIHHLHKVAAQIESNLDEIHTIHGLFNRDRSLVSNSECLRLLSIYECLIRGICELRQISIPIEWKERL